MRESLTRFTFPSKIISLKIGYMLIIVCTMSLGACNANRKPSCIFSFLFSVSLGSRQISIALVKQRLSFCIKSSMVLCANCNVSNQRAALGCRSLYFLLDNVNCTLIHAIAQACAPIKAACTPPAGVSLLLPKAVRYSSIVFLCHIVVFILYLINFAPFLVVEGNCLGVLIHRVSYRSKAVHPLWVSEYVLHFLFQQQWNKSAMRFL